MSGRSPIPLVVDNDEYVYLAIRASLHHAGSSLLWATSVGDALTLVDRHQPSVVIIDVGLPDRSGYELTRELRALGSDGPSRIIILTGHAVEEEAARAAGADGVLAKPFRLDDLLDAMQPGLAAV